jgi:hypothetical protein
MQLSFQTFAPPAAGMRTGMASQDPLDWMLMLLPCCAVLCCLPPFRLVPQANTQQLAATCAALKAQREARAANLNPTRPGILTAPSSSTGAASNPSLSLTCHQVTCLHTHQPTPHPLSMGAHTLTSHSPSPSTHTQVACTHLSTQAAHHLPHHLLYPPPAPPLPSPTQHQMRLRWACWTAV